MHIYIYVNYKYVHFIGLNVDVHSNDETQPAVIATIPYYILFLPLLQLFYIYIYKIRDDKSESIIDRTYNP